MQSSANELSYWLIFCPFSESTGKEVRKHVVKVLGHIVFSVDGSVKY
jgi:hypothetical protein